MDRAERDSLITRYRLGYIAIVEALSGVTDAELDARAGQDEWSARQIVHHLGDSEMVGAVRLRRLLAEDSPEIDPYDEPTYARVLHYDRPIESSLALIDAVHRSTAELLDRLTDDDLLREGHHPEHPRYRVEDWLRSYVDHTRVHVAQIKRALGRA